MPSYENKAASDLDEKALEDLVVQVRVEFNRRPYLPLRYWVTSPELEAQIDKEFQNDYDRCAKLDNIEGPW